MSKKKLPDMTGWTNRQVAEFWMTHSSADYWEDMEDAEDVEFEQYPKGVIAMRLDDEDLKQLKHLATEQGIGYSTLIRMWIKEKLSKARAT